MKSLPPTPNSEEPLFPDGSYRGPGRYAPLEIREAQQKTPTHNGPAHRELPADLVTRCRNQAEPIGNDEGKDNGQSGEQRHRHGFSQWTQWSDAEGSGTCAGNIGNHQNLTETPDRDRFRCGLWLPTAVRFK